MVLQPVHAGAANAGGWFLATPLSGRPDANRIAGITGTLVLNAAAFMLLLAPLSAPAPVAVVADVAPPIQDWVREKKPEPPRPPEEVKPREVPPQPRTVVPERTAPAPVDVPILVDQGIPVEAVATEPVETTVATIAPPAQPVGQSLSYIDAPAPAYPRTALLQGAEGTVVLRVTVGTDGRPTSIVVERSSGRRDLDEAAQRVLKRWTFQPAVVDGQAVEAVGLVPIDFKLG